MTKSTTAFPAWADAPAARFHLSALSDPELEALLARLLAHRSATIRSVEDGLAIWLFRRAERAEAGDLNYALTADQQACQDVIELADEVYNGGFNKWIGNAYPSRGVATVGALEAMGANRVAAVVRKALVAIPDEAVRLFSSGGSPYLPWPPFKSSYPTWPELNARTERRLDRLDAAYFRARETGVPLSALLVTFARERQVGPMV
jgi:hypothetical protein